MDGVSSNEAQELDEPSVPWRPRLLAFGQYRQESEPANKGQNLRVVVRSPDGSDTSFLSSEFSNSMHLGSGDPMVGVERSNHASNANSSSLNQRQNGLIPAFSHVNVGSPLSSHDFHAGYGRSISKPSYFTPHVSQNSPSRLGQQPHQRFSHGRPAVRGSEWNPIKVLPPSSSFSSGGQRSPGSSSLNNSMPWGRRANLNSIPPPSRGRNDLGRIA